MTCKYESIVQWGRSYQEYIDMFDLTEFCLNKSILGCGDGPAGFNHTMTMKGKKVKSIDPIYQYEVKHIEKRINDTFNIVINQTKENADKFVWTKIKDIETLGNLRMSAMREFLNDFENGKKEGRYVYAELPSLPFADKEFDLALSSHFLFLYTDNLTMGFHIQAITEMLRVSKEIRIFPLLDINANRSPYVNKIIDFYSDKGCDVKELKVNYEFQKGGNTMLQIIEGRK